MLSSSVVDVLVEYVMKEIRPVNAQLSLSEMYYISDNTAC